MPTLPFDEGDRVRMDDAEGQIVTVNHDDTDNIIYLVKFDDVLANATNRDGEPFEVRTVWVNVGYLELVQPAVDWAKDRLRYLAAQPPDPHIIQDMISVRRLHDKWAGVDPNLDARREQAAQLLAGLDLG